MKNSDIRRKNRTNFEIDMKIEFTKVIDIDLFWQNIGIIEAITSKYYYRDFKGDPEPKDVFRWRYLSSEFSLVDDERELLNFTQKINDKMDLLVKTIDSYSGKVYFTIVYNIYKSYGAGLVIPKETITLLEKLNSGLEFCTYYFNSTNDI
jgi:hypothetical protein